MGFFQTKVGEQPDNEEPTNPDPGEEPSEDLLSLCDYIWIFPADSEYMRLEFYHNWTFRLYVKPTCIYPDEAYRSYVERVDGSYGVNSVAKVIDLFEFGELHVSEVADFSVAVTIVRDGYENVTIAAELTAWE